MAPAAASPWLRTVLVVCGLAGFAGPSCSPPGHRHLAVRLPRRLRRLGPRRGSVIVAASACRAGRSPGSCPSGHWSCSAPSPMARTSGTTRSPSSSTPPGPAHRPSPARDPLRDDLGPGRGQLLPGGAAGDVRDVLAVCAIDHPGARHDGGHGCGGRRRHGGAGHAPPHASPRPCPPPSMRRWPGQGLQRPPDPVLPGGRLPGGDHGDRTRGGQRAALRGQAHRQGGPRCDLDDLPTISTTNGEVDDPESDCRTWPTLWAHQMAVFHPEVTGLLMGRWDILDHVYQGHLVNITQPAWYKHNEDEIEHAVDVLSAGGAHVMLFTMPYIDPINESIDGTLSPEDSPVRVQDFNRILTQVRPATPGWSRWSTSTGSSTRTASSRRRSTGSPCGGPTGSTSPSRAVSGCSRSSSRRWPRAASRSGQHGTGLTGELSISPAFAGAAGTRWCRAAPSPTTRARTAAVTTHDCQDEGNRSELEAEPLVLSDLDERAGREGVGSRPPEDEQRAGGRPSRRRRQASTGVPMRASA